MGFPYTGIIYNQGLIQFHLFQGSEMYFTSKLDSKAPLQQILLQGKSPR